MQLSHWNQYRNTSISLHRCKGTWPRLRLKSNWSQPLPVSYLWQGFWAALHVIGDLRRSSEPGFFWGLGSLLWSFHPFSWSPSQGRLAEPRRNPRLGTRAVLQMAFSLFIRCPKQHFRAGGWLNTWAKETQVASFQGICSLWTIWAVSSQTLSQILGLSLSCLHTFQLSWSCSGFFQPPCPKGREALSPWQDMAAAAAAHSPARPGFQQW